MKNLLTRYQSPVFALLIFVLLAAWLASGYLRTEDKTPAVQNAAADRSLIQKVRVRIPELKRITLEIVLNGRTESARAVTIRAETEGRVIAVAATRGAQVNKGEVIVQLDKRDRQAWLEEAHALLEERKLEYAGAKKLRKNNLQSETQVAKVATQLATSKALVERIELELRNTRVTAPFDGILDQLPIEVGSYLGIGDEVGRLLEQDPIIFVGYVSQQERNRLVLGDKGIARLVTRMVVEGELRYIAAEADPTTRTFRVELEIPNPDGSLVSGITAEIRIPVRHVSAFLLSPALLSLNSSDQMGVKAVNQQNRVEFQPIEVVKSTAEGLWVSGIPGDLKIITVGQGFVRAGDEVIPVDEREITSATTGN